MDEFYTVNQAAATLKVHPLTIRRYIKEGNLKAFRAGGNIRITLSDLRSFAQTFVPKIKNVKESHSIAEANFSFDDPIFRLKARGLGITNKP